MLLHVVWLAGKQWLLDLGYPAVLGALGRSPALTVFRDSRVEAAVVTVKVRQARFLDNMCPA
jgi:hypothetical protein